MAENLDHTANPPVPPPPRRHAAPYARRFIAALVVLAVALVAAGVLTWVFLAEEREGPWSAFRPTVDDPVDRAAQIATHVQRQYRAAPGTPLTTIRAGEDVISDLPGHDQIVAIADDTGPTPLTTISFEQGSLLFYKLCGPAPGCAADPDANPGIAFTLYSRQALELALYGLKYVREADAVIVLLPNGLLQPAKAGDTPPPAVRYFTKKRLRDNLDRPLSRTLTEPAPTPDELNPESAAHIDRLVGDTLYALTVKPAPDQSFVIYELSPPPAAAS